MTPEQFERWLDFARRMARTCFNRRRRPDAAHIIAGVEQFFDGLDAEDIPCLVDWDSSVAYPVGHRYRTERVSCWTCRTTGPDVDCTTCHGAPSCVGTLCSDLDDEWVPHAWEIPDEHFEAACERWAGPIRCCIRAGLDVASAPSCGVMGFTAGDLRRMYPEGVPAWVKAFWDGGETIAIKATVPGVGFIPEVVGPSEAFDDMPDDAGVWL
jgi:hypothetical protein